MKLSQYLESKGLHYSDFAAKLGVAPSTVHRWLAEKYHPSLAQAAAVERATKGAVKLSDFLPKRGRK